MEQKNLYLVRGLPGSGKTTFSKSVEQEGDLVIAADDFMINAAGKYEFDAGRLDEVHLVHLACARKVSEAMKKGTDRIFVHNTFTEDWEIEPYVALAKQHQYRVFSLIVENRHEHSSLHDTPPETLKAMRERFSIKL